ncbi:phosphatidylserine/phosphatidylglycerophosphate/cardiolipin synthase family protein [Mycolicibacterium sp. CR10]|uniref:phosphatidylserine/phosphatidylglycerophosphate/ cardiolipin synthase family protein n=1 Tax=Mycolicibacterium sp. CR10 TaxID=2562314 RepID=UPI0010BF7AC6|nr:phosphatidylserine/phosphatidylglycerophosphate/cardiolipin synthase family protein [Mycolicibacterium sp. CR10]
MSGGWFLPAGGPGSPDEWCFQTVPTAAIRVHVSRVAYYDRLAAVLSQAKDNNEILLVGWQFGMDGILTEKFGGIQQLKTFLEAARGRNARVRVLATPQNSGAAEVAKAAKVQVDAAVDDQLLAGASHHQKAVFVKLDSSSHLFVGGMDLALGRRGWLDVQAEIIGVGADLGRKTLEERWESVKPPLGGLSATQPTLPPATGDAHQVQFVRTYPPFPTDTTNWQRTYAKDGDHTYYSLLSRAIGNARKTIYLEEQFFQTMGPAPNRTNPTGGSSPRKRSDLPNLPDTIERQLADAIGNGVKLVVVAAHRSTAPRIPDPSARDALVKTLSSATNPPVLLQTVTKPEDMFDNGVLVGTYYNNFVHSKTWIFDDEFVLIGSGNLWPRSLVSVAAPAESEFGVAFTSTVDGTTLGFPKASFARALRITMWERLRRDLDPNYSFPRNVSTSFADETTELQSPIGGIKPFVLM